jgi:hypothetical protein
LSNQGVARQITATSSKEIGLLRHFRYHVAPWIDTGDPESPVGIKVMLLARNHRPLLAAILALAARQRSLVSQLQNREDLESSFEFREEAKHGLAFAEDSVRNIGQALLTLIEVLSSSPLGWQNSFFCIARTLSDPASLVALGDEFSEMSFWIHLRIGKDNSPFC